MLGTDAVDTFQRAGYEVVECDLHNCDILNIAQIETLVSSSRPDVIIHTAAYTDVDRAESDEAGALRLNEIGTKNVALVAKKYQAKIVYISTDYVFDGTQDSPYTEDALPNPIGVYGKTKLRGEQQILNLWEHESCSAGPDFLIVRIAWLYGIHGKNFVSAILQRAQQQDTLRVVNDQVGSPTYTRDVADAILALLSHHARGILHVTNSGRCSWFDFAKAILESANLSHVIVEPISTVELRRPAPRPAFSVLDTSKFTVTTGQTLRHWKEGLAAYFHELHS